MDADEVGWVVIWIIAFTPGIFAFTPQPRRAHFIALEEHLNVMKIESIRCFDLVKNGHLDDCAVFSGVVVRINADSHGRHWCEHSLYCSNLSCIILTKSSCGLSSMASSMLS